MAVRCRLIGGSFGWSFGGLCSTGILSFSERLKCVRTACQACRRHAPTWRCFPSPFLSEFCAKTSANGLAGFFNRNVIVTHDLTVRGTMTAKAKLFAIDHPLDPKNRLLVHAAVESPELTNLYSGNVTTDANGGATIALPAYFEA